MSGAMVTSRRRGPWRYVVRAVITALAIPVLAMWLLMSAMIAALGCDDGCHSPTQQNWWGYPGQLVLVGLACLLWLVALALGFTSRVRVYRALLCVSGAASLAWLMFIFNEGNYF